MSVYKKLEEKIKKVFADCGYPLETVQLVKSSRVDLGDYQINDCMSLAKKYGKNPKEIAEEVCNALKKEEDVTNVNVAGPGFINLTFTEKFYLSLLREMQKDIYNNIDKMPKKKIFMDYGGANAAKALHVGHMRSANIGEAVRRLAICLGQEVTSDVHLGDMGRQSGMVISELQREQSNLPWFQENYQGTYPEITLTNDDLKRLYPKANLAAKEDEERMNEVRNITLQIDKGDKTLSDLWKKIVAISSKNIQKTYDRLHCHFDLWEGEMDACKYVEEVLKILKGHLVESEGALIMDVSLPEDKKEIAPLIVMKSDGATIYATRDLGSLYSRIKRFAPDEIWYFADERQALYFEQVFRASYKTGLVPETCKLQYFGFGTMNGKDGKPFKTRDGGVMDLDTLLQEIKKSVLERMREDIIEPEREEIAEELTIATLKYADLLPFRGTDYIFDLEKFSSLEGKTGPYLLYSTIRMKSLLRKANNTNYKISKLSFRGEEKVALELFELPRILERAYQEKSLNEICEYLYRLTSAYNKFYSENHVLSESDSALRDTWLALTKLVMEVNILLLDILAIKVPEKM